MRGYSIIHRAGISDSAGGCLRDIGILAFDVFVLVVYEVMMSISLACIRCNNRGIIAVENVATVWKSGNQGQTDNEASKKPPREKMGLHYFTWSPGAWLQYLINA